MWRETKQSRKMQWLLLLLLLLLRMCSGADINQGLLLIYIVFFYGAASNLSSHFMIFHKSWKTNRIKFQQPYHSSYPRSCGRRFSGRRIDNKFFLFYWENQIKLKVKSAARKINSPSCCEDQFQRQKRHKIRYMAIKIRQFPLCSAIHL